VSIHPAQLYSSALSLVVFVAVLALGRRGLKPGLVFWSFLILDSALRFALAFVRYAEPGGRVLSLGGLALDYNQLIAVAVAIVSIIMLARLKSS
jgi:prolipoprotein diacylglyceryltransferase